MNCYILALSNIILIDFAVACKGRALGKPTVLSRPVLQMEKVLIVSLCNGAV